MAASELSHLSLDDNGYVMVAAIDFGTTYSGYAFSFKSKPEIISMNKNWGENLGFQSYKTPTSVLTGPDHNFLAFGHEAEQKYAMPEVEGEHYMYKHFKMILHQKKHLTRNTTITSTNGHIRPAMDIFVMAIKYLKEHLLEVVGKEVASLPDASLVHWVITVPAIWSEEAKNFTREAAFKAGCIQEKFSKQLVIALEPEAASLYCRQLEVSKFTVRQEVDTLRFKSKTKYLVIDAGGGTIDITAHEVLLSGDLKELYVANGGSWGGTKVDENFVSLLKKILGADFINAYKQQCPQNWLSVMTSFESLKKAVRPDGKSKIVLPLVWSMASKYMEICNKNIENVFKDSSKLGVTFQNGSIVLSHEATIALFQPVLGQITSHIQLLLQLPVLQQLSYILLVGGFAESPMLQKAIESITHPDTKLLVPSEAQLSIIKGAAQFGYNVSQIVSRIAKQSYGYKTISTFIEGKHDPSRKLTTENELFCMDIFKCLVRKGVSIEIGKILRDITDPVFKEQNAVMYQFFATDCDQLDEVEYVNNPKFVKLGEIIVKSPNIEKGFDRKFELQVEFGGTELRATATDISSGCTAETTIDLLQ